MKHISEIIPEAIGHIRPLRVLNLYAGIGGNRKLWENVEVTAVEYNEEIAGIYKDHFPGDEVIVADAHEYLLNHYNDFDFIWSSPPCQSHSRMMKATRKTDKKKYFDAKLWQEIIFLDHFYKGQWVVENVIPYYEPLVKPTSEISRHLFWSNFKINPNLSINNLKGFIQSEDITALETHLGVSVLGRKIKVGSRDRTGQILRNCVHPDLGLYIFEQAQGIMRQSKTNQLQIF